MKDHILTEQKLFRKKGSIKLKRFGIFLLVLFLFAGTSASASSYAARYKQAYALYEKGKYRQSIQIFRQLLEKDQSNDLADNCQYWIGESYFALHEFKQAIMEFDRTLTFFPNNKREDAFYKIAQCHERLGDIPAAREMYTRFIVEFPGSRHIHGVLKKLESLHSP